eukprot:781890-Rhodomonas_salina.2
MPKAKTPKKVEEEKVPAVVDEVGYLLPPISLRLSLLVVADVLDAQLGSMLMRVLCRGKRKSRIFPLKRSQSLACSHACSILIQVHIYVPWHCPHDHVDNDSCGCTVCFLISCLSPTALKASSREGPADRDPSGRNVMTISWLTPMNND